MFDVQPASRRGILALNLTSEGLKYPPEVRVQHETCSTICGTPVQAILDQKNLTGSAGGAREGQNMAHLGHINGQCNVMYFDLPWPLLPTVSNFYGLKRFYSFGTKTEDIFLFECPSLLCFFCKSYIVVKLSFILSKH